MSHHSHRVKLDGLTFNLEKGENLLSGLLAQSANIAHGCRAGVCGACRLYHQDDQTALLSCQTSVQQDLSLTRSPPRHGEPFVVCAQQLLDLDHLQIQLLGPCDDSFGDRLCMLLPDGMGTLELMAVNIAGQPLQLLIQRHRVTAQVWHYLSSLEINDAVLLSVDRSQRKGRLLVDLCLPDAPVVVISGPQNYAYETFWREAMAQTPGHLVDFMALTVASLSDTTQRQALTQLLQQACQKFGAGKLQIVYHGTGVSSADWCSLLSELRIRATQLHFVR